MLPLPSLVSLRSYTMLLRDITN
uniref:Uncharacterized protein n=1 Tax=Arundo donax TaxID=35708 RepID=A0A0A9B4H0_ARUDO